MLFNEIVESIQIIGVDDRQEQLKVIILSDCKIMILGNCKMLDFSHGDVGQ